MTKKQRIIQFLKFLGFSASAGVIQIAVDTLLFEVLHLEAWLSYLVALVASVLWNFTLNRKFTFKSAANVPIAMLKVACYYLVFTPLTTVLQYRLTGLGVHNFIVLAGNMLLNVVTEYLFCRFVVYRGQENTQK